MSDSGEESENQMDFQLNKEENLQCNCNKFYEFRI